MDPHAVAADIRAALGDARRAAQRIEHAATLAEGRTAECLTGAALSGHRGTLPMGNDNAVSLLNAARDEIASSALFSAPDPRLVRRERCRRGPA